MKINNKENIKEEDNFELKYEEKPINPEKKKSLNLNEKNEKLKN